MRTGGGGGFESEGHLVGRQRNGVQLSYLHYIVHKVHGNGNGIVTEYNFKSFIFNLHSFLCRCTYPPHNYRNS